MTNQAACITWRLSMLALTVILIAFFVFHIRHGHATRYPQRIAEFKEQIFTVLSEVDPDRAQYDKYESREAKLIEEKAFWAAEWDALEPGTVIGKRRGAAMHYTGYPKEIQENLDRLRDEIKYGLTAERKEIVQNHLDAQGSIIENLAIDPSSQPAQELTQLITQHNAVIQERKSDLLDLHPVFNFPIVMLPFFMVLYGFALFDPPQFIHNRWPLETDKETK